MRIGSWPALGEDGLATPALFLVLEACAIAEKPFGNRYNVLIWKEKQVGLSRGTPTGKKTLSSPAGTAGGSPEPAPAGLNLGPETLGQPAAGGGVEEPLAVQRADVISRVTAPLQAGIPLPPETILANPPDLLVEADSSHIPQIDHQPSPPEVPFLEAS